jgi:hypothetical protein
MPAECVLQYRRCLRKRYPCSTLGIVGLYTNTGIAIFQNAWCGTTADFGIDTNTGAPGSAKKDTRSCISNCGMDIVKSAPAAKFLKLGYFEGFNLGRSYLNIDTS